jgi:hypothetical protein
VRYGVALLAATVALALVAAVSAAAKSPRVLRVGKNGTYKKIQSAVNAAHPATGS